MLFKNRHKLTSLMQLITISLLCSCGEAPLTNDHKDVTDDSYVIIQTPIDNNTVRQGLALKYLRDHHSVYLESPIITPKMVVVHRSGCNDYQSLYKKFNTISSPTPFTEGEVENEINISAHYLVDRDGTIYQLLPNTAFSRHVTGLNYSAIGIENVGDEGNTTLTEEQIQANTQLIKMLSAEFSIDYVIGHFEYKQFIDHPLWKEKEDVQLPEYIDPNGGDIIKIRRGLADLNLKPIPMRADPVFNALIKKIV